MSKTYVTLPQCPVCLRRYSNDIKPMTLQPCSHGICEICVNKLRDISEEDNEDEIRCPKCREVVIEEKPNYDMISVMPSPSSNHYWTQKLVDSCEESGISVVVHKNIEIMSKLLVSRIVNDDRIQSLGHRTRTEWTDTDIKLVKGLKQEFSDCIATLDMDFIEATKWIQVMNLPRDFESYFTSQLITIFENQRFLKEMQAEWLLDLIPTSV
tara:strand:+ start:567 stop:1199 length:633 start_codon:yes stop_codon:yes gene_type:complete